MKFLMKKILILLHILITISVKAQDEKIQIVSKFDIAEFGSKQFIIENFQGIEKLDISFTNSEKLIGKDFKIVVRKYKKGKLDNEKIIIDTKKEESPKIKKGFNFSIVTKHILNNEKIALFFPNFFNKQIFEINKRFKDGTFLLRDVCGNETDKVDFELGNETQIALITPPNDNPEKGNLGYCEVSKGNIDIDIWYNKYKISEFFYTLSYN
jgi:hypothetical protein